MALTVNIGRQLSNRLFKYKGYLYGGVKCYSDKSRLPWNYLWEPEEYNKKNHAKHAEKYKLHPDEYQVYDPYERSTGDYPKLPMVGPYAKDPFYPYDIPVYKKNYHEPLHDRFEMMSEDRYNFGYKFDIEPERAAIIFLVMCFSFATIIYLTSPYPISLQTVMEKQYPYQGKTYYTFEPLDKPE